jgi:hypothetical protein
VIGSTPDLERRYKVYKGIGIAGVIALVLNFWGGLPSPYEGEPLSYPLLIGVLVWIGLLWAGIAFIVWAAYRAILWTLNRIRDR